MNRTRAALVVEGGGMRGVFTAGVLDEFLDAHFDPFDLYLGVSAGACNLSSHVAGQAQRNLRLYAGPMCTSRFISPWRFLRGGHWMDLDWFWDDCARNYPLDVAACVRNTRDKEFLVVCTSVETGKALYLTPTLQTWDLLIKASSAVPLMYRTPIAFQGGHLVDGGVGDAIPVEEAARRGAKRIVVIRSRPRGYRKTGGIETRLSAWVFRAHPGLCATLREKPTAYNRSVAFIAGPPPGLQIFPIEPPPELRTQRTTQDPHVLQEDYQRGREAGRRFLQQQLLE